MLEFKTCETYDGVSRLAARMVAAEARQKPDLLFCASAGGSPTGLYQEMARLGRKDPRLFGSMRVLTIDEWAGLPAGHPASCKLDVFEKLVRPLSLPATQFLAWDTTAPDLGRECARVGSWLDRHGPVDVCILGIGLNGHLAMNEPGEFMTPGVHLARLHPSSRKHAMLRDLKKKPTHGLSLGMADILKSKRVLLLANGLAKAKVIDRLRKPAVTSRFPASFLWLHPVATVICDRAALSA